MAILCRVLLESKHYRINGIGMEPYGCVNNGCFMVSVLQRNWPPTVHRRKSLCYHFDNYFYHYYCGAYRSSDGGDVEWPVIVLWLTLSSLCPTWLSLVDFPPRSMCHRDVRTKRVHHRAPFVSFTSLRPSFRISFPLVRFVAPCFLSFSSLLLPHRHRTWLLRLTFRFNHDGCFPPALSLSLSLSLSLPFNFVLRRAAAVLPPVSISLDRKDDDDNDIGLID